MITRERWQRIKDLFNQALNQPAQERSKFISEACGEDETLREEVESLISAHEEEDDFLDAPAHELAAEILTADIPELRAGQQFGPYTILSSLGSGGMGEVYLAQDASLDRKVALKLLTREFARDQQRVQRFEQEARAASTLNHPNVCVIHEIGKADDGRHFIKMEFIDGITLRRRMAKKRLTWKEALDVAAQVAWALDAAHAAHIVHRDIKPENIMVRQDGYVKVLDFGIAKLNAGPAGQREVKDYTTTNLRTAPGTQMGTAKYMSPEHLREQTIDARTDIWSLGVVLYEMVTGSTPFDAPTTNETIAIILERQATQLDFSAVAIPLELQQVIRKALSKKRDERYHTIREFASDLRKLRRHPSLDAADGTAERLEPHGSTLVVDDSGKLPGAEATTLFETVLSKIRSQAVSTADYVLSEIKQHKAVTFAGVTVVLALLIFGPRPPSRINSKAPSRPIRMEPLTNSGNSVVAAISPDGKYVAHAERNEGLQELMLTDTATHIAQTLVGASSFEYRGIAFSPDSNYVYFSANTNGGSSVLYQMLPSNPPRPLMEGVDSPISFSPKGDRFAFVRADKDEYSLMIAGVDGTDQHVLATRKDGNKFSIYGPAWSPDGRTVVCSSGGWGDDGYSEHLTLVDVQDGNKQSVLGKWYSVLQIAWKNDGSGLLVSAAEQALSPYQLWNVSYPAGETNRTTSDISEYKGVSFAPGTNSFVSIRSQQTARIWVMPEGDIQRGKDIAQIVGLTYGLSWSSKEKIVYSSMTASNLNISAVGPDGSSKSLVTNNARDNYTPASSADGRYIVFASNRSGKLNIWRMNAEDGGGLKQLTFSDGNSYPSCSPDGKWVVYDNQSKSEPTIWRVPMEGGTAEQLSTNLSRMPIVSPNGDRIACRYLNDDHVWEIAILPFAGGPPIQRVPIRIMPWQTVQWTKDGLALTYIDPGKSGVSNIWRYDLAGGPPKQITDFKTETIFAYSWSPDQKQLACERGTESRDVMIFKIQ